MLRLKVLSSTSTPSVALITNLLTVNFLTSTGLPMMAFPDRRRPLGRCPDISVNTIGLEVVVVTDSGIVTVILSVSTPRLPTQ